MTTEAYSTVESQNHWSQQWYMYIASKVNSNFIMREYPDKKSVNSYLADNNYA